MSVDDQSRSRRLKKLRKEGALETKENRNFLSSTWYFVGYEIL
jgi:hypothetical protein